MMQIGQEVLQIEDPRLVIVTLLEEIWLLGELKNRMWWPKAVLKQNL